MCNTYHSPIWHHEYNKAKGPTNLDSLKLLNRQVVEFAPTPVTTFLTLE
jgi:hypothetical protein